MATISSLHERKGEKVAVLLNANAGAVTEALRREVTRFVPEQDVFFSRSLDDAGRIAHEVVERGYTTVLTGGGDGTFAGFATRVMAALEARPVGVLRSVEGSVVRQVAAMPLAPPKFGVLKLGTGNALANLTGSSSSPVGVVEDILRTRSGDVRGTRRLHFVEADGKIAPFAGLGYDGLVLNDYVRVKNALGVGPLRRLLAGPLGYAISVGGLSVPRQMFKRGAATMTVINEGSPAQQIAPDGRPVGRPIGHGEVLFHGPCRVVGASTVPSYGFDFQVFPHALRAPAGQMQLRLSALSVPELLPHVPQIWKGRTPTCGFLDFHCDRVRLRFDRDMPFQIGGDAEGWRREVVLGTTRRPLDLLDFKAL